MRFGSIFSIAALAATAFANTLVNSAKVLHTDVKDLTTAANQWPGTWVGVVPLGLKVAVTLNDASSARHAATVAVDLTVAEADELLDVVVDIVASVKVSIDVIIGLQAKIKALNCTLIVKLFLKFLLDLIVDYCDLVLLKVPKAQQAAFITNQATIVTLFNTAIAAFV